MKPAKIHLMMSMTWRKMPGLLHCTSSWKKEVRYHLMRDRGGGFFLGGGVSTLLKGSGNFVSDSETKSFDLAHAAMIIINL